MIEGGCGEAVEGEELNLDAERVSPEKRYFRLVVEYDGTDFHGWQVQPTVRTVQGDLKTALEKVTRNEATIQGASRTDRGVHALGQVARCIIQSRIPEKKLQGALNGVLPADVVVREVEEVAEEFHPRFQARGKHYRYLILASKWGRPMLRRQSWHFYQRLDLDAMNRAAKQFIGEHDFAAFAPAREDRPTVRTIMDMAVTAFPESDPIFAGLISVDVAGDGFLWNQVRTMVGTLVEIGRGRFAADDVEKILASRDRRRAGPTAPAQGLTLMRIFYGEPPVIETPEKSISGFTDSVESA